MLPRPPISTLTDTLFPYTALFRSACLGEVAGALRLVQRAARGVELLLDPGLGVDLVLFGLPPLSEFGRLLFEVGEFGLERGQPVLRRGIGFLAERRFLDLHLADAAVAAIRSEERRVGKEGVRTFRYRWWPY